MDYKMRDHKDDIKDFNTKSSLKAAVLRDIRLYRVLKTKKKCQIQ